MELELCKYGISGGFCIALHKFYRKIKAFKTFLILSRIFVV